MEGVVEGPLSLWRVCCRWGGPVYTVDMKYCIGDAFFSLWIRNIALGTLCLRCGYKNISLGRLCIRCGHEFPRWGHFVYAVDTKYRVGDALFALWRVKSSRGQ
jgi:hypothetical protein